MKPIGMIGLGLLGSAIARRLIGHGFAVLGFDIQPERCRELEAIGGRAAGSSNEVVRSCPRLLLSLPDSAAVESVLAEIQPALYPGHVVIDTTTGDPERTVAIGAELAKRDVEYLDATVLGSSDEAGRGEVIIMAGGPRETCDACADIFRSFARMWFHLGPSGSGARMKLVVNLVLGLNRAALAEGLAFARSQALDPAAALEVLRAGAAYSRVMNTKGPKMLARDFAPQARLRQHLKDVELILDAAARNGARTPLSLAHRELLLQVVAAGFGDEDNAAILRAFEA